jgi:hypothetical protein
VHDACEIVRDGCSAIARAAHWIEIDASAATYAAGTSGLDPAIHLLEAQPEDVARYVLILDATNFGSGWFSELALAHGGIATTVFTRRLTEHARGRGGPWTPSELRSIGVREVADVYGLSFGHELADLYADALRQLGRWLGRRTALEAIAAARGSAARLATQLVAGMPAYADPGLLKRAQITANDLALAGVAEFHDIDRLTIFADDLVPHVLRCDGVLRYAEPLAVRVDGGELLPHGDPMEVEIRACAVEACERLASRAGVPPRTLDNWLWHRGLELPDAYGFRRHRTRTTAY